MYVPEYNGHTSPNLEPPSIRLNISWTTDHGTMHGTMYGIMHKLCMELCMELYMELCNMHGTVYTTKYA